MRCQIKWKPAKPNSVKLEGFPLVFDDGVAAGMGVGGGVGTAYKKKKPHRVSKTAAFGRGDGVSSQR